MNRLTLIFCAALTSSLLISGCAHNPTAAHQSTPTQSGAASNSAQQNSTVQAQAATVLQQEKNLWRYRLANGMELIVKQDLRAPTAIHMLWVRAGAIDETDGTSGIAHMLEHMMFKGSALLGPGEFSRRVAQLGGSENAFTTQDNTTYYQKVPADKIETVMKLEADRFANNQWPDKQFLSEREVVKEERRMRIDDQPRAQLFEQLNATAFIASPQRRPTIGWMDDIDHFRANDVRDFYHKWYVPANAAIIVVGNVDPKKILEIAQNTYGKIPPRELPVRKITTEPLQRGKRHLTTYNRTSLPMVIMAYKIPRLKNLSNPTDKDRDALALLTLNAVLSGYDGARLDRTLAQGAHRVADAVSSSADIEARGDIGLFTLMGIPANGQKLPALENKIHKVIENIAKNGISQQELQRVITQFTATTIYSKDSLDNQAIDLGEDWVNGWPIDSTETLIALLRKITTQDVQRVAAKYFNDMQLTTAYLLPDKNAPQTPSHSLFPRPTFRTVQPLEK